MLNSFGKKLKHHDAAASFLTKYMQCRHSAKS